MKSFTKVKRNGKVDLIQTFVLNLPQKRKTRSLNSIRKDLNKTQRILAM